MVFAENTSVPVEKSKAEIEKILMRYGADQFTSGWDQERGFIGFKLGDRFMKFIVPLPRKDDKDFHRTPGRGYKRTTKAAYKAWEQACRQRWRALALVIKAKLEAIESGISDIDTEFMAYIMLPDGQTVGEHMLPQIALTYENGKMPQMLPMLEAPKK